MRLSREPPALHNRTKPRGKTGADDSDASM
jgi:hypothetical protein